MKLQIDTENKTITVEGIVPLSEFMENLNKLFPEDEWKQYSLQATTVINNWSTPIIIRDYPVYPQYPNFPWVVYSDTSAAIGNNITTPSRNPQLTTSNSSRVIGTVKGIFNVEI